MSILESSTGHMRPAGCSLPMPTTKCVENTIVLLHKFQMLVYIYPSAVSGSTETQRDMFSCGKSYTYSLKHSLSIRRRHFQKLGCFAAKVKKKPNNKKNRLSKIDLHCHEERVTHNKSIPWIQASCLNCGKVHLLMS